MAGWTVADIPGQRGRSIIVTGGTEGLGFETALALARAGGDVILASRNADKGADAVHKIRTEVSDAAVRFERLDLGNLSSINAFSERIASERPRLDLLINNAGIMTPPKRVTTADGFELQFGANHLGPFALTGRLLPLLRQAPGSRVVDLTSVAHRGGAINFDDLQSERSYNAMRAYSQSKLAMLMFAFEFERRSKAGGWGVSAIAAHPGVSRTNLIPNGAGSGSMMGIVRRIFGRMLFQPAAQGALPTLFAATAPEASAGGFYGPNRMRETRGNVAPAKADPAALDSDVASRLWLVSEQLTGVTYP
jgi:NAD(P)-dependent dehydrogenase (short-subunit alcohol dehydrogenase family)